MKDLSIYEKRFMNAVQISEKEYYDLFADQVNRSNFETVQYLNIRILIFLAVYGLIASGLLFHSVTLAVVYLVFALFYLALEVRIRQIARSSPWNSKAASRIVWGSMSGMLAFFIVISVFPFPDRASIFFALIIVVPVLYNKPQRFLIILMSAATALFLTASWLYKTPTYRASDIFCALTTWLLSIVLILLVSRRRLREGRTNKQLHLLARTDIVTGLPNRFAFHEILTERLDDEGAKDGFCLFLFDIDGFKQYNDTYGHIAGDRCLSELGQCLLALEQETGLFFARYGGEEFVAIGGNGDAVQLAERVVEAVRLTNIPASYSPFGRVTVSLGGCEVRPGTYSVHDSGRLLEQIDRALYRAKEQGKNRAVVDRPVSV